jgi:hypothetical protein
MILASILFYANCFIAVEKIIHPNSKFFLKKEGQVTYNMTFRHASAKFVAMERQ